MQKMKRKRALELSKGCLEPQSQVVQATTRSKAFIAHGGESKALEKLCQFLKALGVEPMVVEEQSSEGREKEQQVDKYFRDADCEIVLATYGKIVDKKTDVKHPRLNVVDELARGRKQFPNRIILLLEKGTELPSNQSGIVYERFTKQNMEKAFIKIATELEAFGLIQAVKPSELRQKHAAAKGQVEALCSKGILKLGFERILTQEELQTSYPLTKEIKQTNLIIKVLALTLGKTRQHLHHFVFNHDGSVGGEPKTTGLTVQILLPNPNVQAFVKAIVPLLGGGTFFEGLEKTLIQLYKLWENLPEDKRSLLQVRLYEEPMPHYSLILFDTRVAFLNLHCPVKRQSFRLAAVCRGSSSAFSWYNTDFGLFWDNSSNKKLDSKRAWTQTLSAAKQLRGAQVGD